MVVVVCHYLLSVLFVLMTLLLVPSVEAFLFLIVLVISILVVVTGRGFSCILTFDFTALASKSETLISIRIKYIVLCRLL